ncbi:MAG: hypothetical protein QM621_00020 [Aeromicrobium sp.]|uniref:hypothetical protein n=1 Tax=Aeromicrobium sp. TaxID=1871063 RepID=UPI0039E6B656
MWDPAGGALRVARAGAAGLTVAGIAVVAHVLGGGAHASWIAVVPAALAVTLVAWLLAGRRLSVGTLLGLLSLAQLGVHGLSEYLHNHAPWSDGSMTLAHGVGVLASALALAFGEGLLWRLHAWLTGGARAARLTPLFLPRASVPAAFHVASGDAARWFSTAHGRRGPPVLIA